MIDQGTRRERVRRAGVLSMLLALGCLALLLAAPAQQSWAQEPQTVVLTIKDHRFTPNHLDLSAHTKFKLVVKNLDDTVEEFESVKMNREKIVPPHGEVIVLIGPLDPGEYDYFGDFHQDTAQGTITVR